MKKLTKYNQLIIGLIIGAATTLSISALAEYVIEPNPYPVTLNGVRIDIEGYNINGYTYFKLRDVGEYLGFGVDFYRDTIQLTGDVKSDNVVTVTQGTPEPTVAPTATPVSVKGNITVTPNTKYFDIVPYENYTTDEKTSDSLNIYILNNEKYVDFLDISRKYSFNYSPNSIPNNNILEIGSYYVFVKTSYYENILLPKLIK